MEKFLGLRPKTQRAAATAEEEVSDIETSEGLSEDSEKVAAATSTTAAIAQLAEQQKALAEQIAAL